MSMSGNELQDPLVKELLETFSRDHHYCDDCWYTCPKHPEGCCNDAEEPDACNCGADEHNAKLYEFAVRLQSRIPGLEDRLFTAGAMEQAPCFCCGYNGPGYFSPRKHPCAARHHNLCGLDKG